MLLRYIEDEERTWEAFTEDGYYRTGDLVEVDSEGTYTIAGRASADFVRFNGLRIPAYEVESHICELLYVAEAHVLSVPDKEYGQRVGALIRLRPGKLDGQCSHLTLGRLRKDLAGSLSTYKLPTLLRVVGPDEDLPTIPQGKLARSQAMKLYFTTELATAHTVEIWRFNVEEMNPRKAWDWGGVA
ncbi:hypothetical protein FE257_010682 [Aspergillus nanangensis]|uniref:AMP-binding enzyme C-terminal domain-containing protein n=1 Tax=Aspergillus nanangensis TaxID=2582783 RepID=A0AAD4CI35_ASPNN|nr:hypothetical protein FE257_010682 [Aspergillus nanangensis]